jgi:hypothetical protein
MVEAVLVLQVEQAVAAMLETLVLEEVMAQQEQQVAQIL